ncbi:hypothetical protein [Streptomyces sp. 351MFTsu5.1]|uniref:hypothetical protein n=1 Tax=Streptomyces sp. 351MFTsu5.1 TaxID=1172180 RepID=UPI00035CBDF1|nr:hypothetical protein [Streptomyces sp. 351MFTsu5.1]
MESPQSPTAWYFFSDDLPDGEVIVPIKTPYGLAFAIRRGAMTQEMLDGLNQTAEFVLGVGLAHLGHTEKPPDPGREE